MSDYQTPRKMLKRTSLSALPSLTRAMSTLFILLGGTFSEIFFSGATWPIVKYTNGTVGVKNDGGTVQVQSTHLMVDGNLSVAGRLIVQGRDLEERVSSLETSKTPLTPVCQPPGGDKLHFDGTKLICVCISKHWSG